MDLGCLDLGCIEKQISQSSVDSDVNPSDSLPSTSKPSKNKASKEANQPSPLALNRLTTQIKKPPRRKTSPLGWFPRKKVDSYLKRKIKSLQEIGGMNSTLDETLGDTNPHFSKVLREKMAVKEAAQKVVEARKAALVEASWCRILRAARIESKEAEVMLAEAEKSAAEAFESAKEIGVIMYDIQDCPRKHYKIETSAINGAESATHTVATSFDTAFEVDKQVAVAVKAAFVRLSTCASIGKEEFKELLRKISQNPADLDENCQDFCGSSSECESDDLESKSHKNENLVDMMLKRLRCLHEEELASLATIVATCGLNAALAESEDGVNGGCKVHEELPGLDKFLVKHLTGLEREVQEAKNARKNKEIFDKDNKQAQAQAQAQVVVPDLGSMLMKHTSKLEKEIEETKRTCGARYEPRGKRSERSKLETKEVPGLGEVLVKHVSRLEKEVQEAKNGKENLDLNKDKVLVKHVSKLEKEVQEARKEKENLELNKALSSNHDNHVESLDKVLVKRVSRLEKEKLAYGVEGEVVKEKRMEKKLELEHGEGSLDQIMVKHKSRLEREKMAAAAAQEPDNIKHPLVAKREARERELQEAWGGMSFGNSIRPHVSRLQRDKAAWIKAEEEERRKVSEEISHSAIKG